MILPDNIVLLYQPPYSSQVNPTEPLWQWSKREIANQVFTRLDHLKEILHALLVQHLLNHPPSETVADLEAELHDRVYRLYGLTREEIALIEN